MPATWLKMSHFAGGASQLRALRRRALAYDDVLVAKKAECVAAARVCFRVGCTAGREKATALPDT